MGLATGYVGTTSCSRNSIPLSTVLRPYLLFFALIYYSSLLSTILRVPPQYIITQLHLPIESSGFNQAVWGFNDVNYPVLSCHCKSSRNCLDRSQANFLDMIAIHNSQLQFLASATQPLTTREYVRTIILTYTKIIVNILQDKLPCSNGGF
ncbi:hypothetical protein EV426DRAFT_621007 [Tirmania nivea]|nr:hypothetical protein EV426DRAFT_621007 [Tirmania nivea]